jgi:hypothetical protein
MTKQEIIKSIHYAIINLTLLTKAVDENGKIKLDIDTETKKNIELQIEALEKAMDLLLEVEE